jgi:hypothetical protein
MIPRDLFFAAPLQIWHLFWLLLFAALILYSAYPRIKNLKNLVQPPLQPMVLFGRDPFLASLRYFSLFLAWILAVFALMEPLGDEAYPKAPQEGVREGSAPVEVFLLIDVSQSMGVRDVRPNESRLQGAVEVADAALKKLRSDPTALFVFTSQAFQIVPITYDGIFVRMMLRELILNQGGSTGTLIGNALLELNKEGLAHYPKAPKAVVLISDGGDNLVDESGQKALQDVLAAAAGIKVPIFTVGMGSENGGAIPDVLQGDKQVMSHLEEKTLKGIAEASGGKYFKSADYSAADLASMIAQSLLPYRLKVPEAGLLQFSQGVYKPLFQIPLGFALLFFLLFAFLPYGKKRGLALIPILFFSSLHSQDAGEDFYDSGQYQKAADWYSGEIKSLPVPWLRDKLFYDLGVAMAAKEEWKDAAQSFFMVSKDAYSYPLFRLRLVYSRLLALLEEAKKEKRPELLQEGLWIIQIYDPHSESPLSDLKKTFQMELGNALQASHEQDNEGMLESLIRTLQFAASLPKADPDIWPALSVIFQEYKIEEGKLWEGVFSLIQLKEKQTTDPSRFLEGAIALLSPAGNLSVQEAFLRDASQFYPLVNKWQKQQYEKGLCQCEPWKEAMPLFTEGLQMQRADLSQSQFPYTYSKWSEALRLLKHPPSGGKAEEQEKENKEQVQELQEMQDLDKQFQKPIKPKEGEGMKW